MNGQDRTPQIPAMDPALAGSLDRYAAVSGHRLVEEILAEHQADLFRPPPPPQSRPPRSGQARRPRPQLYWLDRD